VASRRLVDQRRSEQARADRELLVAPHTPPDEALLAPAADTPDSTARDDSLALLLLCCHPALTRPSQVALTLRAVAGLSTAQIARAFLVPEATMAQRIAAGVRLLEAALPTGPVGPYQLQAAIAAVHAEAPRAADTDWAQIQTLYRMLGAIAPGPMVELNHAAAVAVAMVDGPAAGLAMLEPLLGDRQLRRHHRLHAVHAHLLEMDGRGGGPGRLRHRGPAGHQHPRAALPQRQGGAGGGTAWLTRSGSARTTAPYSPTPPGTGSA
jgi:predicted RNA polymerase sigma factor